MNYEIPQEKDECKAFVEYLRFRNLRFTHIANEFIPHENPQMRWRQSGHRKAMGVNKGFPDYVIIIPARRSIDNNAHMLYIEMKQRKNSYPSPEQKAWIESINKVPNNHAVVAKGSEQAIETVEQFLR